MAPLHIVRPIAAPARAVVEHIRASFAASAGKVWLVDVSGPTFSLVLHPGPLESHTVWASVIVRDTADGSVLVGRYRGWRGVSFSMRTTGFAWLGALLLGAPLLFTTLAALVPAVIILVRRSGLRTLGDPEAFAAMCAAIDAVLMPLPLGSPYRTALAQANPDEARRSPIAQSHPRATEATQVWILPPRAPLPAALAISTTSLELPEIWQRTRTADPLVCRVDVAAEPAAVLAHLCAAFPEHAEVSTAAAHTTDVTPTGFVLVSATKDLHDGYASANVELTPLAGGTRIEVRWSRFRMRGLDWLGYLWLTFCGLALLPSHPLLGALLLLMVVSALFVHFHRAPRAAAFDLLVRHLQVPLIAFPPTNALNSAAPPPADTTSPAPRP